MLSAEEVFFLYIKAYTCYRLTAVAERELTINKYIYNSSKPTRKLYGGANQPKER